MFAFIIQVFSSVRDSLFSIKGLSNNTWISWNIFIAGFLKIWHHLFHKFELLLNVLYLLFKYIRVWCLI